MSGLTVYVMKGMPKHTNVFYLSAVINISPFDIITS